MPDEPTVRDKSAPAFATGGRLTIPPQLPVLALAGLDFAEALRELSTANTVYVYVVDCISPTSEAEVAGASTCFRKIPFLYIL